MAKTLNCLQIGIQKFAEYTYLVGHPDIKDRDIWKPSEYSSNDQWCYYGVDADPLCILEWHKKQIPNTKWINVYLDEVSGVAKTEDIRWMWPEHQRELSKDNFFVGKITLTDLIKSLDLRSIEILAMDIEGFELPVFLEYSWHVRPKYLIVETHAEKITDNLNDLFRRKGYQKIHEILTNRGTTSELVYTCGKSSQPFFDCKKS